jgi:carboxymethylenebutenolidase
VNVPSARVLSGFAETSVRVEPGGDACRLFTMAPSAAPPWPAVLILHSAFGIDDHLRGVALDFTARGYLAAVPDLYCNDADYANHSWRHIEAAAHLRSDPATGTDALSAFDAAERERIKAAAAWFARRTAHLFPSYVKACFGALRDDPNISFIGALGYCMGGKLSGGLAAEGVDLSAAVVFYGAPPSLDAVPRIRCPIQGHYAAHDPGITDKVPAFDAAMREAGKAFTWYRYDAPHGFSLSDRLQCHDAEAARQSMARVHEFLRKHLQRFPERTAWPRLRRQ